jgi:hypothetical protein
MPKPRKSPPVTEVTVRYNKSTMVKIAATAKAMAQAGLVASVGHNKSPAAIRSTVLAVKQGASAMAPPSKDDVTIGRNRPSVAARQPSQRKVQVEELGAQPKRRQDDDSGKYDLDLIRRLVRSSMRPIAPRN